MASVPRPLRRPLASVAVVFALMVAAVACSQAQSAVTSGTPTSAPVSTSVSPPPSPTPTGDVQVPNVGGLTEAKARSELASSGFAISVKKVVTMDEAPGYVTSQKPAGGFLPYGSTVNLNVALAANQWGYNFGCCTIVTSAPPGFCSVFKCVARFTSATGNVVECIDQTYTRTDNLKSSCHNHGGPWRSLLQPKG